MSYVKIWVHGVWGTKNHEQTLHKDFRYDLFRHIKENAKEKEIFVDFINGHTDHVHILYCLNAEITIAKTMNLIKGESSYWINKNNLVKNKFEWADKYFAISVSESMVNKVRDYIKNQEEHHKKVTWAEEYAAFIKKYKFIYQG